mgnify:CR=1 FL=1|tara:strand:+ start:485 stop:1363 length:879 start_codon:yes stop_codon:yes gene_type:complete
MKVLFLDWWNGYDPYSCKIFGDLFLKKYNLELSDSPDVIVYSVFGRRHEDPKYSECIKVGYSAENTQKRGFNVAEALNQGHFFIDMTRISHPRHFRLPNAMRVSDSVWRTSPDSIHDFSFIPEKKGFCSFAHHAGSSVRENFVKKLSGYKKVSCGGKILYNLTSKLPQGAGGIGLMPGGKPTLDFVGEHKFHMAFENSSFPGYCTEKIWWGFLAKSIPLYWGDPTVYQDFNEGSFLNRHDFDSDENFIKAIKELDNDDELYHKMLISPKLKNPPYWNINRITPFFQQILESI